MSVVAVQKREDKRGNNGRGNVDGVPLGRTTTVSPMDPTPSLAEDQQTKKRPAHRIGRKIAEVTTLS